MMFAGRLIAALCLCSLLGACTVTYEVDSTLFPREPAAHPARAASPIALVAAAQPHEFIVRRGPDRLVFPIGRIAEQALAVALRSEFGVEPLTTQSVASDSSHLLPYRFALSLQPRHYDVQEKSILIPGLWLMVPVRKTMRLAVEVQLLEPGGRVAWSKVYDSGERFERLLALPTDPPQVVVRTHELAYELMREAARDAAAWLLASDRKETVL